MQEETKMTGYPSIDKPWLKYYSEEEKSAPLPNCTIYEYLYDNNISYSHDIALCYLGTRISYGKLLENIEKTAKAFAALGVSQGDVVAVCMPSTPEVIYTIYALNRLGAVPNLLDPRYNENGLAFCLEETPASLLITYDGCYGKFIHISSEICPKRIVYVSAFLSAPWYLRMTAGLTSKKLPNLSENHISWSAFMEKGDRCKIKLGAVSGDNIAAIIHTGGTTGNPKGIVLSNSSINAIAHQYRMLVQPKRGETLLDIIPPFASYGLCASIHMPLTLGVSVELCPKFQAEEFGSLLHKYKPTYVMGVPSFWESILTDQRLAQEDMSYLLSAACGGDSMNIAVEERINRFLANHNSKAQIDSGYGMSEMSATACVSWAEAHRPGSVGIPLVCTTFKIVNPETGEECTYGETGEICISGPGMMIGYLNREDLTKETIRLHKDGIKWLHTGDLGHITDEGFVYHDGRIKRLIVRFDGFKIYPAAVEQAIQKTENVLSCAVVKYNKPGLGIVPVAVIVAKNPHGNIEQLLKNIKVNCYADLAERAVPQEFFFASALPLTTLGKVDYLKLEKQVAEQYNLFTNDCFSL